MNTPISHEPSLHNRYMGALLGLACGDAVGTTVEFSPRGSFAPVTGMTGGGPFGLQRDNGRTIPRWRYAWQRA